MGHNQSIRKGAHPPGSSASDIPDKLYFRIGEVARLCDVPAYVLRFWESEFPQLKPNKGGTGQRLYRRRDVEVALRVKSLLKDEGYTIPGARSVLKFEFRHKDDPPQLTLLGEAAPSPKSEAKHLRLLRRELQSLADLLAKPITPASPKSAPHSKSQTMHAVPTPRRAPARPTSPEIPFD